MSQILRQERGGILDKVQRNNRPAVLLLLSSLVVSLGSQRLTRPSTIGARPFAGRRGNDTPLISRSRLIGESQPPLRVVAHRGTELARYNMELGRLVDQNRAKNVFEVAREMKEAGIRPDHTTYECLLQACSGIGAHVEAWAVYEDMMATGVPPKRHTFHCLLHVR